MARNLCLERGPSAKYSMASRSEFQGTSSAVVKGSSGRRWIRGEAVGRGSLGTVYQAMDQQTGELLAVKEAQMPPKRRPNPPFAYVFPLLVLKEIYHYWIFPFFFRGLQQMEKASFLRFGWFPVLRQIQAP